MSEDDKLAADLEKALDFELPMPVGARKPEQTSLTEQWNMSQNIRRELKDRLRREQNNLISEHDRKWVELTHAYKAKISDALAKMKTELDREQRQLAEAYQQRKRELDLLAARIEGEEGGS